MKLHMAARVTKAGAGDGENYTPLWNGANGLMITTDFQRAQVEVDLFTHRFGPVQQYKVVTIEVPDDGQHATILY